MKKIKNSKFFIVFLVIMAFIYFYDKDLYNELKTSIINGEKIVDTQSVGLTDSSLLSPLRVYFFDVGQADSILVECDNDYMLIDAGNNEDGTLLVDYLKSLEISHFKYLIGTHAHEDHIGGMDDVINNFSADLFYMPDATTTTKTFEDVLDALLDKNMYFDTPKIGDTFSLGNGKVEVLSVGDDSRDLNNTSIVLRLTYSDVRFLFTGDMESSMENAILNRNVDISSDVLKVGHHGSSSSTTAAFLKKVNPTYSIISLGKDNSYGHPHDQVLNRLNKLGTKIYRTDELGTIIVSSNGKEIGITNISTDIDGN